MPELNSNRAFVTQNNDSSVNADHKNNQSEIAELEEVQKKIVERKKSLDSKKTPSNGKMMTHAVEKEGGFLTEDQIKDLFLAGATKVDIYWINYMIMGDSTLVPLDLLSMKQKSSLTWKEVQAQIESIVNDRSTVQDDVYMKSPSVTETVYEKENMRSLSLNMTSADNSIAAFSTSVNSVFKDSILESQINETHKPQFNDRDASSELIDPVSGSLTRKQNLIHLPGVDGLDLDVGLMYRSNKGLPCNYYDWYSTYWENWERDWDVSYSKFGAGWDLQFPYVENIGSESQYHYYHDGKGNVYQIGKSYDDDLSNYTNLINYEGKDVIFVWETYDQEHFSNGSEVSSSYLEYSDKKREYFSHEGYLLGIVDRFGNKITFNYSGNLLTSIKDSTGRTIEFVYDSIFDYPVNDLEKIEIKVKENETVVQKVTLTYKKQLQQLYQYWAPSRDVYVPLLYSITDQLGENTYFDYRVGKTEIYEGYNIYSLLEKVTYTNSSTAYGYEGTIRHIANFRSMEEFRITSRSDQAGNKTYQNTSYSYVGNYTGNESGQYPGNLPDNFRYSSTSKVVSPNAIGGLETTRLFDKDGRALRIETKASNGERKVTLNTAFHPVFKHLPTQSTYLEYGAGDDESTARRLYSETGYTDKGIVNSQTGLLTSEQMNNPELKRHRTVLYTYEPNYQLLATKSWFQRDSDPSPMSESYTYTPEGRVESYTNAENVQSSYSYQYLNGTRQIEQATVETKEKGSIIAKSITFYGAESRHAYPTEQQQWFNLNTPTAKYIKKKMSYDMGTGLLNSETDGNNQSNVYEYDAGGRLKKETHPIRTNANGESYSEVIDYDYYIQSSLNFDSYNQGTQVLKVDSIKTVTKLSTGSTVRTYANTLYNGIGLPLLEEHWDEYAGKWVFTQYHYDDQGHVIYQKDDKENEVNTSYDAWGQLNRTIDANGNLYVTDSDLKQLKAVSYIQGPGTEEKLNYLETYYDTEGRVVSKRSFKDWPKQLEPITESYRYDNIGNLIGYTDPMSHLNDVGVTTSYTYDSLNRLTSILDALNQTTRYTYNGSGQIIKVTVQAKGGNEETLNTKTYNELGLPTVKQDGASQTEAYDYNSLGQLTNKTDRNGSVYNYSYDEVGQLKNSTVSGTVQNTAITQKTEFIYGDGSSRYQSTNVYQNGIMKATESLYYDSLGQLRSKNSTGYSAFGAGSLTNTISNSLDVLGRMTQQTDYSRGLYVNYQYEKDRLSKVQTNGESALNNSAAANVQYNYFPNNLISSITYPTLADGSILKTDYTYNKAMGWVMTQNNMKGSNVLSSYIYDYDKNGNIKSASEARNNGSVQTTSYVYDALNRLTAINRPDGSTTYTYDVRGNRKTLSDTSSDNLDITDTSYSYDLLNTLTSITKNGAITSFQYYADGLRFLKSNGNKHTRVNYDFNGHVIGEDKMTGSTITQQASYVRGDRVLVKKDKTVNKDYYYLYNGHGDVVQIVDTSGNVVNSYNYDVWGNITSQVEGISNSFKYAGEIYDEETGLYYLRARYYDPSLGRFLNEDTYEGQIDNPLSQNLYTYVGNNPLIYSDPTGHSMKWIGKAWRATRKAVVKGATETYDFLIGDDIDTLLDPNSTQFEKDMAAKMLALNFVPGEGQLAKAGIKAAEKTALEIATKETAGRIAKSTVKILDTKLAASSLGSKLGGKVIEASGDGWKITNITNPLSKNQPIMIRVMNAGSGGRSSAYFRVSVGNKGTLTLDGKLSSDMALTHIDLTENYLEQIQNMINNYVKTGGK